MGEYIKVALPLSLTRSGELLGAIGAHWPDAVVRTDTGEDRYMVIDPDPEPRTDGADTGTDPVARVAKAVRDAGGPPVSAPSNDEVDAFLTSLRDGSMGISPPEWYARMMFGAFREILDSHDAPNYVEQSLLDADTGETYTVLVGRPGGRTPHQLRADAEERAARAEAALAELAGGCGITRDDDGWSSVNGPLSAETAAALDAACGVEV